MRQLDTIQEQKDIETLLEILTHATGGLWLRVAQRKIDFQIVSGKFASIFIHLSASVSKLETTKPPPSESVSTLETSHPPPGVRKRRKRRKPLPRQFTFSQTIKA